MLAAIDSGLKLETMHVADEGRRVERRVQRLDRPLAPGLEVGLPRDVLDLDVDGDPTGEQRERLRERRAPSRCRRPTVAIAQRSDLGEGQIADQARTVGGAIDRRVVQHDGVTVAR